MKKILFLFLIFSVLRGFSNINFLDIAKISKEDKPVGAYNYVKENQQYYDHWSNEWKFGVSKQELLTRLQACYRIISDIKTKSAECYLLLGDIAHYTYNLDDSTGLKKAVVNYKEAIKLDPKDYRAYWFLGNHYAMSNGPLPAFENFYKAEKMLPSPEPPAFWDDYAFATYVSNMPSHCIYAMDKVKTITGKPSGIEDQLGDLAYKRVVPIDKNQAYEKQEIWSMSQGAKTTFVSRPLGIKLLIDTIWNVSIYDYKNNQGVVVIEPVKIANKSGREIGYTIALLMKTVNDNDKLEDYINSFVAKAPQKKQIAFTDKYEKVLAYEIIDKAMYTDLGGGHLYMIGIERQKPKNPGLLLENPVAIPESKDSGMTFYQANNSKDRFDGKIFYAIMLDSCEDINEGSIKVFKEIFEKQIVIE